MLADGPEALILSGFLTWDVPRLWTRPALERHRAALWVTDRTEAGNVIGASIFMLPGMPPVTEIASPVRDGAALRAFDCLTVGCMAWPRDSAAPWGLAPLRGQGEGLGPDVRRETRSFTDPAAYLAAHAEADVGPAPFWTLDLWHLPQSGGANHDGHRSAPGEAGCILRPGDRGLQAVVRRRKKPFRTAGLR